MFKLFIDDEFVTWKHRFNIKHMLSARDKQIIEQLARRFDAPVAKQMVVMLNKYNLDVEDTFNHNAHGFTLDDTNHLFIANLMVYLMKNHKYFNKFIEQVQDLLCESNTIFWNIQLLIRFIVTVDKTIGESINKKNMYFVQDCPGFHDTMETQRRIPLFNNWIWHSCWQDNINKFINTYPGIIEVVSNTNTDHFKYENPCAVAARIAEYYETRKYVLSNFMSRNASLPKIKNVTTNMSMREYLSLINNYVQLSGDKSSFDQSNEEPIDHLKINKTSMSEPELFNDIIKKQEETIDRLKAQIEESQRHSIGNIVKTVISLITAVVSSFGELFYAMIEQITQLDLTVVLIVMVLFVLMIQLTIMHEIIRAVDITKAMHYTINYNLNRVF